MVGFMQERKRCLSHLVAVAVDLRDIPYQRGILPIQALAYVVTYPPSWLLTEVKVAQVQDLLTHPSKQIDLCSDDGDQIVSRSALHSALVSWNFSEVNAAGGKGDE